MFEMNWQIFAGGPVVTKDDGYLIGVVSFGISCPAKGPNIDIYTYFPYYYKWIESVTGLNLPTCDGPQAQSVS